MSAPRRIQRSRRKGWRLPAGAVYVGRPTKWGNPFRVGQQARLHFERLTDAELLKLDLSPREIRFPDGSVGRVWPMPPNRVIRFDAPLTIEDVILLYRKHVIESGLDATELRGKDLACWCPLDQPCHADVLLELANR